MKTIIGCLLFYALIIAAFILCAAFAEGATKTVEVYNVRWSREPILLEGQAQILSITNDSMLVWTGTNRDRFIALIGDDERHHIAWWGLPNDCVASLPWGIEPRKVIAVGFNTYSQTNGIFCAVQTCDLNERVLEAVTNTALADWVALNRPIKLFDLPPPTKRKFLPLYAFLGGLAITCVCVYLQGRSKLLGRIEP